MPRVPLRYFKRCPCGTPAVALGAGSSYASPRAVLEVPPSWTIGAPARAARPPSSDARHLRQRDHHRCVVVVGWEPPWAVAPLLNAASVGAANGAELFSAPVRGLRKLLSRERAASASSRSSVGPAEPIFKLPVGGNRTTWRDLKQTTKKGNPCSKIHAPDCSRTLRRPAPRTDTRRTRSTKKPPGIG